MCSESQKCSSDKKNSFMQCFNAIIKAFTFAPTGSGSIKWDFVHGLFENAIYGGRVDNNFDVRVLTSYFQKYFSETLSVSRKHYPTDTFCFHNKLFSRCSDVTMTLFDR